jgi:hypothetical protein
MIVAATQQLGSGTQYARAMRPSSSSSLDQEGTGGGFVVMMTMHDRFPPPPTLIMVSLLFTANTVMNG